MSIPSGIKGVRFRFGGYTPIRTEELTELDSGRLWVTSKRLFFQGSSRNTKVDLRKIIDLEIFRDALKIEKGTGRADFFTMGPVEGRYLTALIGAIR